jgi:hypothetical protein
MFYDKRKQRVGDMVVSMVRSTEDLHDFSPSTGEVVVIDPDGGIEELWSGAAAEAGDRFRYFIELAEAGASINDMIDMGLPVDCR